MSLMFDPRANALAAYMMNPLLYDSSSNGGSTAAASAAAAAMSSILQQSGASTAVTNQQLMLRRLPPFNAHQYRQQDGGGQPPSAAMAAIAAATAAAEQQAAVLNLAAHLAAATAAANSNGDTVGVAHDQQCGEDVTSNGSKQVAMKHHHAHHDNRAKKLSPSGNNTNSFRILDILDHPTTATVEGIRSADASKMFADLQKLVNESDLIGTLNNNNKNNNNNNHIDVDNNGERRRNAKRRYDEVSGEHADDDAEEEEEDDDDRCGGGSSDSPRSCASRTSLNSSLMSQHGGGTGGSSAAAAKKARKARTIFTDKQLQELETMFDRHKYLSVQDRMELAQRMGLTDTQVKTWYQNRRTKWKRQAAVGLDLLQETSNLAAVQNLLRTNPYWHQYLAANPFFAQRIFPPPHSTGGSNVMPPPGDHLLSAAFGASGGVMLPSTTASLSLPHAFVQQHVDTGVASTTADANGETRLFGTNAAPEEEREEEKEEDKVRCFNIDAVDVAEEAPKNDDEANKDVSTAELLETLPESG